MVRIFLFVIAFFGFYLHMEGQSKLNIVLCEDSNLEYITFSKPLAKFANGFIVDTIFVGNNKTISLDFEFPKTIGFDLFFGHDRLLIYLNHSDELTLEYCDKDDWQIIGKNSDCLAEMNKIRHAKNLHYIELWKTEITFVPPFIQENNLIAQIFNTEVDQLNFDCDCVEVENQMKKQFITNLIYFLHSNYRNDAFVREYINYFVEKFHVAEDINQNPNNNAYYIFSNYNNLTESEFESDIFKPFSYLLVADPYIRSFVMQITLITYYNSITDKSYFDFCHAYKEYKEHKIEEFEFNVMKKMFEFCDK